MGHLVWFFITLVCLTLRKKVIFEGADGKPMGSFQCIIALWHNRVFVPCYVYRYVLKGKKVQMSMLTSASKDGAMLATVAKNYGMDCEVYCVEIDFTKLFDLKLPEPTYVPLPKYPGVSRDLSLICDEAVTVAQIEDVIRASAGKLLRSVKLFDIYRGTGVPEGKKSMAFSLELRSDERTLTDVDCEGVTGKVLQALKEKLNAILR